MNQTFPAEEKFENVINFLMQSQNQPNITLMTTFPRFFLIIILKNQIQFPIQIKI